MRLNDRNKDKNYLKNLNKRDVYQFKRFVNQIKNGTNNDLYDRCNILLVKYIENFYVSLDNKAFDLDDFIQECSVKMVEFEDEELFSLAWTATKSYQKVFDRMSQSPDYDFVEPVEIENLYDEIDISFIDYNLLFELIKGKMKSEKKNNVFDYNAKEKGSKDLDNKKLVRVRKNN